MSLKSRNKKSSDFTHLHLCFIVYKIQSVRQKMNQKLFTNNFSIERLISLLSFKNTRSCVTCTINVLSPISLLICLWSVKVLSAFLISVYIPVTLNFVCYKL